MMLNNIGLPGLLMLVLMAAAFIVPFWKLLPKFGYPAWVSIVAIFPMAALILLWVLAFSAPRNGKEAT